jgi:hypothetical protein
VPSTLSRPITNSCQCAPVFNEFRTVYRVDGVSAIPLEETRATATVNMLASRNTANMPAAPPTAGPEVPTESVESHNPREMSDDQQMHDDVPPSPHVKFAPEEPKQVSSLEGDELEVPIPSSPTSSGYSTPTSSFSTSPVAKALAARLSFWSRLSKRVPITPTSPLPLEDRPPSPATVDSLERRMDDGEGPAEVLDSILAATAPPPSTTEERHSELDDKIVRETTKEFVKGGMYFSYNFGRISFSSGMLQFTIK